MSIPALMIHQATVLDFVVLPATNMDVKRRYKPRAGDKRLVNCRFSQLKANELLLAGMRGSEVTHRVYFDEQPDLREDNRLLFKGVQYILLGVPLNASMADRLWTLDVKAVTQQNELADIIE